MRPEQVTDGARILNWSLDDLGRGIRCSPEHDFELRNRQVQRRSEKLAAIEKALESVRRDLRG